MRFLTSGLLAVSTLFSSTIAAAIERKGIVPGGKLAVYYGQGPSQKLLGDFCQDSTIDIIPIGFVTVLPGDPDSVDGYPGLDFGNQCGGGWVDANGHETGMFANCFQMIPEIQKCQQAGKKILLSIGGQSSVYFQNDQAGTDFAQFMWKAFGPYDPSYNGPRPFGQNVVLDGFDFDIETLQANSPVPVDTGLVNAANTFRQIMGPGRLLTAAPQCIVPDAIFKNVFNRASFDAVFIQFYNTPWCSARSSFDSSFGNGISFDSWASWLMMNSLNRGIKAFIGLPASTLAVANPNFYLTPDEAQTIINNYEQKWPSIFGGVMLWEATYSDNNQIQGMSYAQVMKMILQGNWPLAATTTTTTTTSPSSSSTVSLASTTSTSSSSTTTNTSAASTTSMSTRPSSLSTTTTASVSILTTTISVSATMTSVPETTTSSASAPPTTTSGSSTMTSAVNTSVTGASTTITTSTTASSSMTTTITNVSVSAILTSIQSSTTTGSSILTSPVSPSSGTQPSSASSTTTYTLSSTSTSTANYQSVSATLISTSTTTYSQLPTITAPNGWETWSSTSSTGLSLDPWLSSSTTSSANWQSWTSSLPSSTSRAVSPTSSAQSDSWTQWPATTAPVDPGQTWPQSGPGATVTVITTSYVDLCPTGYTTVALTTTITLYAAQRTGSAPAGSWVWPTNSVGCPSGFFATTTVCSTGCGNAPQTVTLTLPAPAGVITQTLIPVPANPQSPAVISANGNSASWTSWSIPPSVPVAATSSPSSSWTQWTAQPSSPIAATASGSSTAWSSSPVKSFKGAASAVKTSSLMMSIIGFIVTGMFFL